MSRWQEDSCSRHDILYRGLSMDSLIPMTLCSIPKFWGMLIWYSLTKKHNLLYYYASCVFYSCCLLEMFDIFICCWKNTQFHACWPRRELPGEMRMQMVTVVGVTQRWSPTTLIYNQHQPVKKGVWWRKCCWYALVTLHGIPHKSSHIHTQNSNGEDQTSPIFQFHVA